MIFPCESQNLELACFALKHDYAHRLNCGDIFKFRGNTWVVCKVSDVDQLRWIKEQDADKWFEMFGKSMNLFVLTEELYHKFLQRRS